ncbi:MAG: DUF3500 domain-containing protein [Cyclobacteriaceae bacterium]
MKKTILLTVVGVAALSAYFIYAFESKEQPAAEQTEKASTRVQAANDFINSLDGNQKSKAIFDFKDEERYNWHFIPREREGLDLRNMNQEQKIKAFALLNTFLSDKGVEKAKSIMQLEIILKALENLPPENDRRHPEKYYFSIFGQPTDTKPWGWRLEGHHLSINFTSVTGEVTVTPAFWGANPANVPSGDKKGLRVLKDEEDLGRGLVKLLSPDQQKVAIIMEDAPDDVVTGADRKASLEKFSGLKYTDMNAAQQTLVQQILELVFSNVTPDIAKAQMQVLQEAGGMDALYFAWAGSLEVGKRHYYRVHGPSILVEYDNTQNDANHIHFVWRDLTNDFGEDLLAKHYKESGSGHGHSHGPGSDHTH